MAESTTGSAVLSAGQTVSLGNMGVWTPYFDETIAASLTGGSGQPLEILVQFEGGTGVPYEFGDVDFSGGAPDVADWTFLQSVYGSDLSGLTVAQSYGLGDLNGDGIHSLLDLQAFRTAFVAGGGNLADLGGAEVPEPTSFILILLGVMAMVLRESSRRAKVSVFGKVASWISTRRVWKFGAMYCLLATALGISNPNTSEAGLFDDAPLSPDGQSKLLIHFDARVGVDSMGNQVDSWKGYDGSGQNVVATATLAGVGAGTNITTNGTAVIFNETIAADNLHLQTPLSTSGGQYTIIWKGHYDSTNQNGAANSGLYAYTLSNLEVANAPGMNHQRDDFGGGYRVELYPGTTYFGDVISAFDDTSTVWTTVYDYSNSQHRAYANGNDLHVTGSSTLSLTANPTLVIGAYDNGTYFGGSGYSLLGEIEHLIVFQGVLSEPDIAAVESFLGPTLPTLTIDTSSREMTITGGENAININGYEILSAGGSLNPTPWLANNFDAKNLDPVGTEVGQTWDVFSSTSNRLTEAYLHGSSPFDLNRTVSLGQAYNSTIDARDVVFQYQTTAGLTRYGVVQYVASEAITGDFNGDGTVNAADYALWRDSLGATGAGLPADANLDEIVNQADHGEWKAHFGASSSGAANLNNSA
ncbi:MAG: hypothetical protein KDA99_20110, partial [Planctomycetales bacterium]|nr:hypothetical protein [Planctomycetales bacterium]